MKRVLEASGQWVVRFIGLTVNKDKYIPLCGSDSVTFVDGRLGGYNAKWEARKLLADLNDKLGKGAVGFIMARGDMRSVLDNEKNLEIIDAEGNLTGKFVGDTVQNGMDTVKFKTVANGLLEQIGEEVTFFRDYGREVRPDSRFSVRIAKSDSVPHGNDTIKPTVKMLSAATLDGLVDEIHKYVEGK